MAPTGDASSVAAGTAPEAVSASPTTKPPFVTNYSRVYQAQESLAVEQFNEVARWLSFDRAGARRQFRFNFEVGACHAFEARRALGFRPDVNDSALSHWYQLAVNRTIAVGGTMAIGDPVRVT